MHKPLIGTIALMLAVAGCASRPLAPAVSAAPDLAASDIDRVAARLIAANDVKGLAIVLIKDGQIAFSHAYGCRMVEKDLPLEPDTIIYGASLTKATFAYFVMQLVDEGVIDLDRSIAEYLPRPLPEYEQYADLDGDLRWRNLTMRMLLSHTTGFANFRWLDPSGDEKLRFHFDPGTRYAYSGEGFRLAQFVIEEGLGLEIGAEMNARIFDRFGMAKTSMTWRDDFLENYSHNYTMEGINVRHNIRKKASAAGSMDTTPNDWAKFLAAVARGDGLSPRSKQEMISPQIRIRSATQFPTLQDQETDQFDDINLSYGLGWGVFDSPRGRAFFKEGHDEGTANYSLCIEPEGNCILLMSNSVRAEGVFKEVVDTVFGKTNLPWQWEGYVPYDFAGTPPAQTP